MDTEKFVGAKQMPQDIKTKEHQENLNARLGIFYDLDGIDNENVELIAKTYRIIGTIVTIIITFLCGIYGEGETIFFSLIFMIIGLYYRFFVGSTLVIGLFKTWELLVLILKKI